MSPDNVQATIFGLLVKSSSQMLGRERLINGRSVSVRLFPMTPLDYCRSPQVRRLRALSVEDIARFARLSEHKALSRCYIVPVCCWRQRGYTTPRGDLQMNLSMTTEARTQTDRVFLLLPVCSNGLKPLRTKMLYVREAFEGAAEG